MMSRQTVRVFNKADADYIAGRLMLQRVYAVSVTPPSSTEPRFVVDAVQKRRDNRDRFHKKENQENA